MATPAVASELSVGPGLPALKIGAGPSILMYLPGLRPHPGLPTGIERRTTLTGWDGLLDRYTIYWVGRRVRPVGTTFAEMAQDTTEAAEALATGGPIDVMGASTGGIIAIHLAATRPDLVRRLVLVITGTTASPRGQEMIVETMASIRSRRWRRTFATVMSIGGATPVRRSIYRAMGWTLGPMLVGIPDDPTLLLAELDAWTREDAHRLLQRIHCSTLVIGTERDPVFPPESTRALAAGLSDARVVIVPKLAHNFPLGAIPDKIVPFLADGTTT
jgi:pimeloyl-ACP methyl ester carboxylesterase